MENLWRDGDAGTSELDQLVYLSNLIGADSSLVQPGGGNTSVKLTERDLLGRDADTLVVKGSGTDLRTIGPAGFTHLYGERLSLLRDKDEMSDEEMMSFMRACMLFPDRDPVPSVETPLHSLLPARFVAHTHDVATLSLTDTPHADENVRRVFGPEVAFLEYVRPGFPLEKRLAERFPDGPPAAAVAIVMEKHGLAVWSDRARECYENLHAVIDKAEAFVADARKGKQVFGPPIPPLLDERHRRDIVAAVLPAIRGELAAGGWRTILHLDDSPETLDAIAGEHFAKVSSRGVMTPEHILRAGVRPLVVTLDNESDVEAQHAAQLREAIRAYRDDYDAYAQRNGVTAIPDFLKTIVLPGPGIVYAGRDRRNALVAAECYRATMQVMVGAEVVERFEFLADDDACEMEYWPLERRKIEEGAKSRRDLDGKIAVVIGAASGIGRAAALRFAEEGAHVVVADLDAAGAQALAAEVNAATPERAYVVAVDVTDASAVTAAFRESVLHFGGIDILFYSPGVGPTYHSVVEMPDEEAEQKMTVHYHGAVAATRAVAQVMITQGTGGRLIYNASKAAFAPGEGFAAYGASKAALVHYVRNVANELGKHGITANYINADAVDTPMFRDILRQRAERAGVSEEEMLARYAERSALRQATVPPEAVAEAALWLASDRSAYTTGCVITVGGGAEGFPR